MTTVEKIAVFPGSFDPMTTGHLDMLRRAMPLFDKIVVADGINTGKRCFQTLDDRIGNIRRAVADLQRVDVCSYDCLTTDLCRKLGARFILRGVRDNADFEYERKIADINRLVAPDIETVILLATPEQATVSSTMVRELSSFGHDVSQWLA